MKGGAGATWGVAGGGGGRQLGEGHTHGEEPAISSLLGACCPSTFPGSALQLPQQSLQGDLSS